MPRHITAIILALLVAGACWAADLGELERENAALEAELSLAKKKDNYLVFDLSGARVDVKSQGLTLKSIPIADQRSWHEIRLRPRACRLVSREASGAPERTLIKPKPAGEVKEEPEVQQPNQDTFDVQAMEIDDMPTSYRMTLDGGLRLYVRQQGAGFSGWLRDAAHTAAWYMGQSLSAGWSRIRGAQYESVELSMAGRDAQALYWAFLVNSSCIVK